LGLALLALGQELIAFAGARGRRNRQAANQGREREQLLSF
jgi:hypothetical protein